LNSTSGADSAGRKTVLVTRARSQAGALAALLEESGIRVLEVPTIAIAPLDPAPLDAALADLDCYDWLLFTSANAVEVFFGRRRDVGVRHPLPRICSIGPATTSKVLACGAEVALQPEFFQAEGVLEALERAQGGGLRGRRILLPRAKVAREVLPEKLVEQGARVDVIPVYENVLPEESREMLSGILEGRGFDLVAFASSSSVRNFVELLPEAGLCRGMRCAVIGPVTESTAREFGFDIVCMPTEATVPALVAAIIDHLGARE